MSKICQSRRASRRLIAAAVALLALVAGASAGRGAEALPSLIVDGRTEVQGSDAATCAAYFDAIKRSHSDGTRVLPLGAIEAWEKHEFEGLRAPSVELMPVTLGGDRPTLYFIREQFMVGGSPIDRLVVLTRAPARGADHERLAGENLTAHLNLLKSSIDRSTAVGPTEPLFDGYATDLPAAAGVFADREALLMDLVALGEKPALSAMGMSGGANGSMTFALIDFDRAFNTATLCRITSDVHAIAAYRRAK